jgi:hypothetical protein
LLLLLLLMMMLMLMVMCPLAPRCHTTHNSGIKCLAIKAWMRGTLSPGGGGYMRSHAGDVDSDEDWD